MLKSFDNSDGLINISSNREIIYIEVSDDTFAINDELSPEGTVNRLDSKTLSSYFFTLTHSIPP